MNNSMIAASVSMGALQRRLDLLADNIANSNTVGYKRKTAVFEDILTSVNPQVEDFEQAGRRTPLGFTLGWGTRLSSMQLDLSQGVLQMTGNSTDAAIEGDGLFEVRTGGTIDSPPAFTRHGSFQLVSIGGGDRMLVTNSGHAVVSEVGGVDSFIRVPDGYNLVIGADGSLTAVGTEGAAPIALGSLKVVQATKPELLQAISDNLYGVPADINVGDVVRNVSPILGEGQGLAIRQGFVENSNVSLANEITDLMIVQRAYQLSARALTSSDQMMGMANNLRG